MMTIHVIWILKATKSKSAFFVFIFKVKCYNTFSASKGGINIKILLINHFPLEGSGSGIYTKNVATCLRKKGTIYI